MNVQIFCFTVIHSLLVDNILESQEQNTNSGLNGYNLLFKKKCYREKTKAFQSPSLLE